MQAVACIDDLEAFALVGGTLARDRLPDVLAHVESCHDCHDLIQGLCIETPTTERDRGADPMIGTTIGTYRIGSLLAVGGMGRVYRAEREGKVYALKLPRTTSRWIARRFEREIAVTRRLQHANIVAVRDAGALDDGTPFYVMELVEGVSLETALNRSRNREQRLGLLGHVVAIADAMAYAHAQHIAHRDLKPHNVLVGEGHTVILDWGLAKELDGPARPVTLVPPVTNLAVTQLLTGKTTRPGDVLGTPAFMPPEQARGEDVDQRADVYALGAILEQLLVGRLPRKAADAVLDRSQPALAAMCRRAMATARDDRHADAGVFAAELRAALAQNQAWRKS